MIRRTSLDHVGFYLETFEAAQDYDLWLRLAEQYAVANLPSVLYKKREHDRTITKCEQLLQDKCATQAVQEAMERRASGRHRLGALYYRAMAYYHLKMAIRACACHQMTQAREHLIRATATDAHVDVDAQFLQEKLLTFGQIAYPNLPLQKAAATLTRQFLTNLPVEAVHLRPLIARNILGRFLAASAFEASLNKNSSQVYWAALRAIWVDPVWMKNRGLISICLEAIVGHRMMKILRTGIRAIRAILIL